LSIFKRAIFEFDDKKLKNEPIILEGGWSKWTSFYPGFTQSSKNFIPSMSTKVDSQQNKTSTTIKNVLDFDYPEINDLKKPLIAPVSVNNVDASKVLSNQVQPKVTPNQIQPQITNISNAMPIEKNISNNIIAPSVVPSVNRSTKPIHVNKIQTPINNSDTSRHSNDITPSPSSSDDEEDRRIFENNFKKPDDQLASIESTKKQQQPLTPSIPVSTDENQNSSTNFLNKKVKQVSFKFSSKNNYHTF
jgi:hypothetical protein